MAFINVMSNISIRCDCGTGAPEPKIRDIGILASLDPVAIDRASFDLIIKENTAGSREWINNSNRLLGENTLNVSAKLGTGSLEYNLINTDNSLLFVFIIIVSSISLLIIFILIFFYIKNSNRKTDNKNFGISMIGEKEE